MSLTIIIVGGVAGGASAVAKARRTNETATIEMFEKGPMGVLNNQDFQDKFAQD